MPFCFRYLGNGNGQQTSSASTFFYSSTAADSKAAVTVQRHGMAMIADQIPSSSKESSHQGISGAVNVNSSRGFSFQPSNKGSCGNVHSCATDESCSARPLLPYLWRITTKHFEDTSDLRYEALSFLYLRKKNSRPSTMLLRRESTEFLQDVTVEKISQNRQSSIHWEGPSLIGAGLAQCTVL